MRKSKWPMAASLAAACCLWAGGAGATHLYWGSVRVHTQYPSICRSMAYGMLKTSGYHDVHFTSSEVAGIKNEVAVCIVCIQTAPDATAVIMAAGDQDEAVRKIRDSAKAQIATIVPFD